MEKLIELTLPWPPTINTYWQEAQPSKKTAALFAAGKIKRIPRHTFISERGKVFRTAAVALCREQHRDPALKGRLRILILAHPPDRRIRDIDNIVKPLFDALAYGGIFVDDNQIDDYRNIRQPIAKGGMVRLRIRELSTGPGEQGEMVLEVEEEALF